VGLVSAVSSGETDRRLIQAVGLVAFVGATALAWACAQLVTSAGLIDFSPFRIGVATLMLFVASRMAIYTRIRSERHGITSTEAATLVAFMLLPPAWLIVAVAVAMTGAIVTMPGTSPVKVTFNAAKDTIAAAAGVAVGGALGLRGPFVPAWHDVPAIIAVAVVLALTDELLAHPVIALATQTSVWQRFRTNWDIRLGTTAARLVVAIGAMFLIAKDVRLVILVPLVIVGLHFASANRLRERQEREAWQQLAQSTEKFNEVDLDTVLNEAVRRAGELFSAGEVDIEVSLPTVPARLVRGSTTAVAYDGPPGAAPPAHGEVIATALESHDGSADVGEVRLRFRRQVSLSEREQYTLRTFAAALCTAVRNAAAFAEARRLSATHEHAAGHDPLTGLANRRRLFSFGDELLADRATKGLTGMLLIDLNHFKEINDTLGHTAGDKVLAEVALRLAEASQEGDLVSRLGGDEFAILFVGLAAPALAVPRARAVLGALDQPIEIDGMRIGVEASAGVALAQGQGGMQELLRRADVAMYQAKREGQVVAVYAPARDTANATRLALSADLSRAVAERQFTVSFQPVVDLGSAEVISAEALARWHHPAQGDLNPDLFIDAVERSGLLPAFSQAVLDQSLQAAAAWRSAGFLLPVAVNVSPRSVLDPSFPDVVAQRLAHSEVPAEALVIELTESLTLSQLEVVDEVLRALRDLGVRLALDDFGTGYSSLATLARVPVHELKIDRAFVGKMADPTEMAVVRSTIDLGRGLDLLVVAEGVENEEQRRQLWELGCPAGQGHLFARPMPLHRLLATLRRGYDGRPGILAPPLHNSGSVIRLPSRRSTPYRRDELG
jgi:diguanylate cyclase (GGDEF)-like protein